MWYLYVGAILGLIASVLLAKHIVRVADREEARRRCPPSSFRGLVYDYREQRIKTQTAREVAEANVVVIALLLLGLVVLLAVSISVGLYAAINLRALHLPS